MTDPTCGGTALRRFRWWDVPAAHDLECASFPTDAWSVGLFWSELAGVPGTRYYLLAEDSAGTVLGYAGLAVTGGTADVQTLAVAPEARRHGLGGRLLDALVGEARRRRCTAVLLEVRSDNPAAQQLYLGRGFARISVRRGYYDAGRVDAHVLRLKLTGGGTAES